MNPHAKRTCRTCLPAVLAAGCAHAQFQPNPVLEAVPPNTALDLGEYTCEAIPGEWPDLCQGITAYGGFTYDKHRHRMLMFGGGHSTTMRDDIEAFDLDTLTWNSLYESTPCKDMIPQNFDAARGMWTTTGHASSRHTYDLLVVTEGTGEFLLMRGGGNSGAACARFDQLGGEVAHYNFEAEQWLFSGQPFLWQRFAAAEVDPVSGMVIIRNRYGLYMYDPVAKTAREIDPANKALGIAANLVYFPPNDRMYLIRWDPTEVWEITLDRNVWENSTTERVTGVTGEVPDTRQTGWDYDSTNHIIGGGIEDGVFYAYDPLTKTWSSSVMRPDSSSGAEVGTLSFHALDFDPVNGVFIFLTDRASGRRTWAYRYGDSCYPDCSQASGAGVLDIFDFICFQDAFVAGDPYADCDGNGVLDVFDFICFQDAFTAGCP